MIGIEFKSPERISYQFSTDFCNTAVEIIEINGEADHIHILFGYYPQMQLSKYVNNIKSVTSRLINQDYAEHLNKFYWKESVLWTKSYFIASCGGVTVERLKEYVQSQSSPD